MTRETERESVCVCLNVKNRREKQTTSRGNDLGFKNRHVRSSSHPWHVWEDYRKQGPHPVRNGVDRRDKPGQAMVPVLFFPCVNRTCHTRGKIKDGMAKKERGGRKKEKGRRGVSFLSGLVELWIWIVSLRFQGDVGVAVRQAESWCFFFPLPLLNAGISGGAVQCSRLPDFVSFLPFHVRKERRKKKGRNRQILLPSFVNP